MISHFNVSAGEVAKLDALVLGLSGQIQNLLSRVVESKDALAIEPNYSEIEKHRGKQVVISDVVVAGLPGDGTGLEAIDEEALPYFVWENGDERVLLSEDDIARPDEGDEGAAEQLIARICQVFAEARTLGYVGPYHLLAEGTEEHKAEYAKRLYTAYATRQDYADAQAKPLRDQARALLKQAEAIDGRSAVAVVLDWGDGDPSIYIEHSVYDLCDQGSLETHMEETYEVSGWRNATVLSLDYSDLAG